MNLKKYDEKHVRVKDIYGETFTGLMIYCVYDFLMHEYGGGEDGIMIEDVLLYRSQIASIEEIEVHGTVELRTEQLVLRRYCPEDAEPLYRRLGTAPGLYRYSGCNPYATLEMAQETVKRFTESYKDDHFYSWILDVDDVVIGTIGAYDYEDGRIGIGFRIVPSWQGRGYAEDALKRVLEYLTQNEGIPCVTAWCASEDADSKRVLEKAGMRLAGIEQDGLVVDGRKYDKLNFEYREEKCLLESSEMTSQK